jgi:hypothetical protein
MQESTTFFHQLEWPAPRERVAGPIVWLRGWVTGKPGSYFTDVRALCAGGVHFGILGFPRTDLAAHFKSPHAWLPAEYIVGVPVADGPSEIALEAMDEYGSWHQLQTLAIQVSSDGTRSPRVEGEVVNHPGGSSSVRVPHLPFHGHLDEPPASPTIRNGRVEIFGWVLHETQTVRAVFATVDGLVFNALEAGLTDELLASKVPQHQAARHARVRGGVDAPPTITSPGCLRVYAELADGSVALCFARRLALEPESFPPPKPPAAVSPAHPKPLPDLPSMRPRRLLLVARTLQADESTLRALDVAQYLIASGRWAARIVVSEDGPLHESFEASGCSVQIVNPQTYFAASTPTAAETALLALGRQIWWSHLNAAAIFDKASTWAGKLASLNRVPVFEDPANELTWFSPAPLFSPDIRGDFIAPIRGLSAQGSGVILHTADHLVRHHRTSLGDRKIILTDLRTTPEEQLFKASLAKLASNVVSAASQPAGVAAVICPAFTGHPHRALLSALASGVPLITTLSPLLATAFGANEINLIPPGNPLALTHAMIDTLANPTASKRCSAAAAQIVLDRYSPVRQLARWREMLETAIAG